MSYRGIILTGTSGSGKSTISAELSKKDIRFSQVQAVTTRKKRSDDKLGDYEYIDDESFRNARENHELLIYAEYRGYQYGIREKDLFVLINTGKIPILILTPDSAFRLDGIDEEKIHEKINEFLSVFIDASDEKLNERLAIRGGGSQNDSIIRQRETDRRYKNNFLYYIENNDLASSVSLIALLWDHAHHAGVLNHRIINLMLSCGMLLENSDKRNISGASYDLSLGDEYFYAGKIHHLSSDNPYLLIEPYDYAIVTSYEIANFPRDICGRFDLSVSLFFQGIILTNGPQVDPGFKGPLFCLLFNTSSSPVIIKRKQHYTTLEFSKLLEPTFLYGGEYQGKELLHYLPVNAARGAINEIKKDLDQIRTQGQSLQSNIWAVLSLILAILAIWLAFIR